MIIPTRDPFEDAINFFSLPKFTISSRNRLYDWWLSSCRLFKSWKCLTENGTHRNASSIFPMKFPKFGTLHETETKSGIRSESTIFGYIHAGGINFSIFKHFGRIPRTGSYSFLPRIFTNSTRFRRARKHTSAVDRCIWSELNTQWLSANRICLWL